MFETSKAVARRLSDPMFARTYFVGEGVDIGCGLDPLGQYIEFFPKMTLCRDWDTRDGDAQYMEGVADRTYDFVNSSHCLEHLEFPGIAICNWLRILKPGGYLVCLVPDEDMYEQGVWPSTWNKDHESSLTIYKAKSWAPKSVNILDLLRREDVAIQYIKLLTATFRKMPDRFDQTFSPIGESAIEFVVRKL